MNAYIIFILFFFISNQINAQMHRVYGKITDIKTGKEIKLASITEEKSKIGTITNIDGTFSIFLNSGDIKLVFSHEKYESFYYKFNLRNDTVLNIKLNHILELNKKRFR